MIGENSYRSQEMLGVCGTSLVSPGWLVLGDMVGMGDVQTLKLGHVHHGSQQCSCCPPAWYTETSQPLVKPCPKFWSNPLQNPGQTLSKILVKPCSISWSNPVQNPGETLVAPSASPSTTKSCSYRLDCIVVAPFVPFLCARHMGVGSTPHTTY